MKTTVLTKIYEAPPVRRAEILRYAGVRGEAPELDTLLAACLAEAEPLLDYRVCYAELPILRQTGILDLGFARIGAAGLMARLADCDRAVLFAATVGLHMDRLIARYGATSPTKGLLMQAIGAERIEALCDAFCRDVAAEKEREGRFTVPRFSPGYGELPLAVQREIFALLAPAQKIGLTLNESLLMSPTKSVTAIIGVGK